MTTKADVKNRTVKVTDNNGNQITLTLFEVEEISNMVDRIFYFVEDVKSHIEYLIDNDILPNDAENNENYINAVTDAYAEYRRDNDGDSEGMTCKDCLDCAFADVKYEDYILKVHLCKNCIEELKEYNPYTTEIEIEEVPVEKCDNYTVNGVFVNLENKDK